MAVAFRAVNRWVILAILIVFALVSIRERLNQLANDHASLLIAPAMTVSQEPARLTDQQRSAAQRTR
ncbi:MAG: hypothetical protein KGM44_02540 [bacterium]|nr:hypothetical protein [bacterium]